MLLNKVDYVRFLSLFKKTFSPLHSMSNVLLIAFILLSRHIFHKSSSILFSEGILKNLQFIIILDNSPEPQTGIGEILLCPVAFC